jgi:mercuric ion binding protein
MMAKNTVTKNKYYMKILKAILLITIFSVGINFAKSRSEIITIKTTIFCDHCKECESCGGKIEKDLGFAKGIKLLKIDEKAMTITVTFNPKKISAEEIRTLISKYGYDADDVKADPTAYENLDECCKKQ